MNRFLSAWKCTYSELTRVYKMMLIILYKNLFFNWEHFKLCAAISCSKQLQKNTSVGRLRNGQFLQCTLFPFTLLQNILISPRDKDLSWTLRLAWSIRLNHARHSTRSTNSTTDTWHYNRVSNTSSNKLSRFTNEKKHSN